MMGGGDDDDSVRRAIAEKIKEHCNVRRGGEPNDAHHYADASEIMLTKRWAVKRQRAWKANEEVARIERFERALDQAIKELQGLPEYLHVVLVFDASPTDAAPTGIRSALEDIREAADSGIQSAKREAARGTNYRADVEAGAVLRACRFVWQRRDRRPIPRSAHQDVLGPFPSFVSDVFEILGITTSVRSTLSAVNK